MSKKEDEESNFPDKWMKIIKELPGFVDETDAATVDALKKIIVESEGNIYTIEKDKEENERIKEAKEALKEYLGPYRDAVKTQTAKIKYCIYLLAQKGHVTSEND